MTVPRIIVSAIVLVGALLVITLSGSIWETNKQDTFQVKQAFYTGITTCRLTPGTWYQWFGTIWTYKQADTYYFSKYKEEGGTGFDSAPIKDVTFSGRSKADITGVLKYELPMDCEKLTRITQKYGSNDAIKKDLVQQYVTEVLTQTAPLFSAEQADAPKRDKFREIAKAQLRDGLYKKKTKIEYYPDPSNPNKKLSREVTELVIDKDGNPIVVEPSPLKEWGLKIITFNLKELDWDDVTDELLAEKKKIDMKRTLAKAAAVTAQQNAIKEQAEGAARVAKAEADALVIKKTAVIEEQRKKEVAVLEASKKFEVEKMAALEAIERAKKIRAEGMAKAAANAALVKAGLTPREKAEIDKDIAIGVARELAKIKLPTTFIGGGSNTGMTNPIQAMGIEAFYNLTKKIGNPKTK